MGDKVQNGDIVITEKTIDLNKVIANKNPALLKKIPGFVMRYLNRIIHVDEINYIMWTYRDVSGFDFIDALIDYFNLKIEITGLENLPPSGKQFVASNHPLGGLDGIALMWAAHKVRDDVKFPVNDLLMNIPQLKPLFIPINKHGRNTENLQILEENFAKEQLLLYFPAGLVSRKQKGKIQDLEWKHTIINKARIHQRDIIPTFIDARNSHFFYNLAWLRQALGIKTNIEMLYLVNEVFKFTDGKIKIYFGKPIPYQSFTKDKKPKEWAAWLKDYVYNLTVSGEFAGK